jgi:hypothetical protein
LSTKPGTSTLIFPKCLKAPSAQEKHQTCVFEISKLLQKNTSAIAKFRIFASMRKMPFAQGNVHQIAHGLPFAKKRLAAEMREKYCNAAWVPFHLSSVQMFKSPIDATQKLRLKNLAPLFCSLQIVLPCFVLYKLFFFLAKAKMHLKELRIETANLSVDARRNTKKLLFLHRLVFSSCIYKKKKP